MADRESGDLFGTRRLVGLPAVAVVPADPPAVAEKHARFQRDLIASNETVWLVARWLQMVRKHRVVVFPLHVAPTRAVAKAYSDEGDCGLLLGKKGAYTIETINVKGLTYPFTGLADWPFKDYLVCRKEHFDKCPPFAIISVNAARTHLGIVYGRDVKSWTVVERVDQRYDEAQVSYAARPDSVKFFALDD